MSEWCKRSDWNELLYKGQLPSCTSLGGYPLVYTDGNGNITCADCATQGLYGEDESYSPQAYGIHWEGEPIECDECGAQIESAYGPVEVTS